MFLNFLFIPVAAIACTWFPIYYIFLISYCVLSGNILMLYEIGMLILYIVVFAFLIPFILQGFLAIILERKRILVKNFRSLVPSAIFFPLFMLIYAVSITCGVFSYNCKWETNRHAKSISVDKLLADNYGADNSCEKSETVKSSDTEEDEAFTDVLSVTSQSKDLAADKTTNINNTDDGFKSI